MCLNGVLTPPLAEQYIRDLLKAHDAGVVPRLQTIVICISIRFVNQYDLWTSGFLDDWLNIYGALRGVICRLEFEDDCSYFRSGDPRDIFAMERAAIHADREQIRVGYETRRKREAGTIERGLMRASAIADEFWTLFCCFTYAGCAACYCAR